MKATISCCCLRAFAFFSLWGSTALASPQEVTISRAVVEAGGFLVHTVTSPHQSGTTRIRVLLPDERPPGRRYAAVYVLPVEAGEEARYGDGLLEVRKADLHNRYGVVCVAPSFSDLPWYADHPTDLHIRQESYFTKVVVPFVENTYPVRATREGRWLVGFSKSGWGAFSLLLRHPDLFGGAAAWDAPVTMERPDRYGMGPIFGTPENFRKYEVTSLLRERQDRLRDTKRLALLGYGNFREHHQSLHSLLEELRIPHHYRDGPKRKHHWASGWLDEAVGFAAGTADKVKVFLLAGQSNMEGQAVVDLDHEQHYNGGRGTLERVMKDPAKAHLFKHLKDEDGEWVVRDDIFVWYRPERGEVKSGGLSIGYAVYPGRHHFGPELQFGHVIGDAIEEPVLLLKTAWGGKSLYRDFRPPGSGGEVGPYYTKMLTEIREVLGSLGQHVPALAGLDPEIEGFVWFQGWNDMIDEKAVAEYEENLANLIQDLRRELALPALPVVIGETGNCGNRKFLEAQAAVARRPEFAGSVAFVPTAAYLRPREESPNVGHGHHWFGNAESYFLIGNAMGKAMQKQLAKRGPERSEGETSTQ